MFKIILILSIWLFLCAIFCDTRKVSILNLERPVVSYTNPKYVAYMNGTTTRSRRSSIHYLNLHFEAARGMDNNVTISFYFYEYIANMQFSKFFELHFKLCDLVHKNKLLGPMLRQDKFKEPCPYPTGEYHLYNLTMPAELLPDLLPFTRGRIVFNATLTATREVCVSSYIDMEVKTRNSAPK